MKNSKWNRARVVLPPVVVGLVGLALWELGVFHWAFDLESYTLAYPSAIVSETILDLSGTAEDTLITFTEAISGYVIGSVTGLALAVLFAQFSSLRRAMLPIVSGMAAMPIIAVAPLMVLYFGLGLMSKISVVVLMTMPPMTVAAFKGFSSVSKDYQNVLESIASPPIAFVRKLRIPWSLPFIFTALKLNVTLSLIGAIIAEFFAARGGLGYRMSYALDTFNMPIAWGTMLIAALLGVIWYQLVVAVERLAIPWHSSIRALAG